jgi:hypothetical protein
MVETAINRIGRPTHQHWREIAADTIWAVKQGHGLEDQRNNVLHSPIYQLTDAYVAKLTGAPVGAFVPATHVMNERARNLNKVTIARAKRLLPEIRMYKKAMRDLGGFVLEMPLGKRSTQHGPKDLNCHVSGWVSEIYTAVVLEKSTRARLSHVRCDFDLGNGPSVPRPRRAVSIRMLHCGYSFWYERS